MTLRDDYLYAKRDAAIVEAVESGRTFENVGDEFNLSRERVRQIVRNEQKQAQETAYPATIKEMGWAQYLEALSDRLHGHLPDVIGGRAKKDIGNAAKVLRAFSELDIVTAYLDSLPDD